MGQKIPVKNFFWGEKNNNCLFMLVQNGNEFQHIRISCWTMCPFPLILEPLLERHLKSCDLSCAFLCLHCTFLCVQHFALYLLQFSHFLLLKSEIKHWAWFAFFTPTFLSEKKLLLKSCRYHIWPVIYQQIKFLFDSKKSGVSIWNQTMSLIFLFLFDSMVYRVNYL